MGHPSNQALSKVTSNIQLDLISRHNDEFCDVCLRVKQTRIPFPISESNALKCFDLMTLFIGISRVDIVLILFVVLVTFLPYLMMQVGVCGHILCMIKVRLHNWLEIFV